MMSLLAKYNIPAPRYTSYPTVPFWTKTPDQDQWKSLMKERFSKTNSKTGISLYIHLPFCESLCTYCACNTRITVNHKVELPYLETVLAEWQLYLRLMDEKPRIKEIHLGGGTPTFFSPGNLHKLIRSILETSEICEEHDFSFEGHPANTTAEHLETLQKLGFRRVSFGVQDFDPLVQDTINRYQSVKQVRDVVHEARRTGYTSVNFDLVYGLPYQKLSTITETVKQVVELHPDRVAFYSYAHVPWMRPGQRKFSEKELPLEDEKRALYERGLEILTEGGYQEIGLDHFALPGDPLFTAWKNKTLHRNFMGYTDKYTELMISLGASSISDTWNGFAQNLKVVESYQECVSKGLFPITKGHMLTENETVIRKLILDIMCKGSANLEHVKKLPEIIESIKRLADPEKDGLVTLTPDKLTVTPAGMPFLRNICLCFDTFYWKNIPSQQVFSTVA